MVMRTQHARAAIALLLAVLARPAAAGAPLGRWEAMPLPSSSYRSVYDLATDTDGALWIVTGSGVHRWDGERFAPPKTGKLSATSYYLTRFYGGGGRPLYLTRRGSNKGEIRLYRLTAEGAKHVADVEQKSRSAAPPLYVARSGTVFHRGSGFVAVLADGAWQRHDAALSQRSSIVAEQAGAVHFFCQGNLHSYDGQWHQRGIVTVRLAAQGSPTGTLLGADRLLAATTGDAGVAVYELPSLRPALPPAAREAFATRPVRDLFRLSDGSAVVCADEPEGGARGLHRLWPDGRVERLSGTEGIEWDTARSRAYGRSVLSASDGSLWLDLPHSGVARLEDGALRVFDWRDRLGSSGRGLAEGPEGRIYAAGRGGLYVFLPDEPPGPPPPDLDLWETVELASCYPTRDSEGNVWLFRKDQPGKLSRWDGQSWRHLAVPFDTATVLHGLADDRGRVLWAAEDGAYLVGPAGVERHEDMRAMLVWADVDGATRFETGPSLAGCIVLDGGKLWYGVYGSRRAYHYDGAAWKPLTFMNYVYGIQRSATHGVLFRSSGSRYYTYAEGWKQTVWASRSRYSRWLLGPQGIQPFEEELLEQDPTRYAPVQIDGDGSRRLLVPDTRGEGLVSAGPLSSSVTRLTPGFHGGHWSARVRGGSPLRRILGGRMLACDLSDSPLDGWDYSVRRVLEDRGHNLWFDLMPYGTRRLAMLKRLSGFRLHVEPVPADVVRSVSVRAAPELPGLETAQMQVFWRVAGGPWRYGAQGGAVTIRFPADGDYTIELTGMDRLGGTAAQPVRRTVRARVPLPETRLTADGPFLARDVLWEAPVKLVPSEPKAKPYLYYRIDGAGWRLARSGGRVLLGRLERGQHDIELAAQERGFYRDRTPVRLRIDYWPSPDHIVSTRVAALAGKSAKAALRAQSEIAMAGPIVVPALERTLAEAKDQPGLAARLEALLARLRPRNTRQ